MEENQRKVTNMMKLRRQKDLINLKRQRNHKAKFQ